MAGDRRKRAVQCEDATGRERVLNVFPSADGTRLVLKVPPGECSVLSNAGVKQVLNAVDVFLRGVRS